MKEESNEQTEQRRREKARSSPWKWEKGQRRRRAILIATRKHDADNTCGRACQNLAGSTRNCSASVVSFPLLLAPLENWPYGIEEILDSREDTGILLCRRTPTILFMLLSVKCRPLAITCSYKRNSWTTVSGHSSTM